jgi:hypothetical protein
LKRNSGSAVPLEETRDAMQAQIDRRVFDNGV